MSHTFSGGKSVVILYIGEISKTERRISFIFLLSFLWTFGYFVIILAQNQIPVLFTIIIICMISLTGFLITCFIPESKYWYATHRDYENTRASILWYVEIFILESPFVDHKGSFRFRTLGLLSMGETQITYLI